MLIENIPFFSSWQRRKTIKKLPTVEEMLKLTETSPEREIEIRNRIKEVLEAMDEKEKKKWGNKVETIAYIRSINLDDPLGESDRGISEE